MLPPLLSNGILLKDGTDHLRLRKILGLIFHNKSISSYYSDIYTVIKSVFRQNIPTKLYDLTKLIAMSVIANLVFGQLEIKDIIFLINKYNSIISGFRDFTRIPYFNTPYYYALKSREEINFFILNQIKIHNQSSTGILAEILKIAETEDWITLDLIIETCAQLLFAGFDTTAQFLFWSIALSKFSPDWYQSLNQIFAQVKYSYEDFSRFKQNPELDAYLTEIERLYPPAIIIPRGVTSDFTVNNIFIPKGWQIHLSPVITHRLPDCYRSPNRFNPGRFLSSELSHKYSLYGFGGGLHGCLGREIAIIESKLTLYEIISEYSYKIFPEVKDVNVKVTNNLYQKFYISMSRIDTLRDESTGILKNQNLGDLDS
jgi:cytochrome P450